VGQLQSRIFSETTGIVHLTVSSFRISIETSDAGTRPKLFNNPCYLHTKNLVTSPHSQPDQIY